MSKEILTINACCSSDEPHECIGICEQVIWYRIESVCKCVHNNEDLEKILYSNGLLDYLYLSAHGCPEGLASKDEKMNMSWKRLATLLCHSKCMNEDSILMLSCCRGGLMEVAYDIFLTRQQICYVLGPRQSLTSADMHICFGIFFIIWKYMVLTLSWHVKR